MVWRLSQQDMDLFNRWVNKILIAMGIFVLLLTPLLIQEVSLLLLGKPI